MKESRVIKNRGDHEGLNLAVHQLNKEGRLVWLDIAKGIGILLVIFGHVYRNHTFGNFVYAFHMPLFFVVAGWLYKEKANFPYIRHRFFTVMVPYFCFGAITLIYWQFIERHFRNIDMTFLEAVVGLFRGQYEYLGFNVHLWFLPCFFMTVIIYNALQKFGKRITRIITVIMSVIYILNLLPSLPWGFDRVFKYIGFYAIGNVLANYGYERLKSHWTWLVAILLLGIVFVLSLYKLPINGLFWFITGTIGSIAVMIISVNLCTGKHSENFMQKALQFIGQISLIILCIHGPVYRVIAKLLSIPLHMDTEVLRANFLFATLIVCITVLVCVVVYSIIASYIPWMIGKTKPDKVNFPWKTKG